MKACWALSLVLATQAPAVKAFARAQEGDENARKALAEAAIGDAQRLYDSSRYGQALDKLAEAYGLYPSPKLHFNFGKAYRALLREVDALEAFERFLAETSDSEEDLTKRRKEAALHVDELRERVGYLEIATDIEGAEVVIARRSYGTTPLPRPLRLAAGMHDVGFRKEGAALWADRVEIGRGERLRLAVRLKGLSPLRPADLHDSHGRLVSGPLPAPEGEPLWRRWWFWTGAGALVAGAAVGLVFGLSRQGGATNACTDCDRTHRISP